MPHRGRPVASKGAATSSVDRGWSTTLLWRELRSSSSFGFAVVDKDHRYVTLNHALARMNGVPLERHLDRKIWEILGKAAWEIEQALNRTFTSGEPLLGTLFEARLPGRYETGQWIVDYVPLKDSEGRVQHVADFVVEISQQRRLEDWLKKLAGAISGSELRNQIRAPFRAASGADPEPIQVPLGMARRGLTPRERQVVRLVADGCSNKETATALGISLNSVAAHRSRVMSKLRLRSYADLIRYALKIGIISM